MKVRCVVCLKEWDKPGDANLLSHGCCEGYCEKVLNDWTDMPRPKPPLNLYYRALLTLNVDRAQLNSLGGKWT